LSSFHSSAPRQAARLDKRRSINHTFDSKRPGHRVLLSANACFMSYHKSEAAMKNNEYWSPYRSGIGLGLTLLASFILAGQGLGASRAYTVLAGSVLKVVVPAYTSTLAYLTRYLTLPPFKDRIVLELGGVLIGSLAGALWGRNFKLRFDGADHMSVRRRLLNAFVGGIILGFASRLARGCTSGVGLTGSSQLAVAGWIFMVSVFAGGFLTAALFRRLWS
jgi:uncharacterized protein